MEVPRADIHLSDHRAEQQQSPGSKPGLVGRADTCPGGVRLPASQPLSLPWGTLAPPLAQVSWRQPGWGAADTGRGALGREGPFSLGPFRSHLWGYTEWSLFPTQGAQGRAGSLRPSCVGSSHRTLSLPHSPPCPLCPSPSQGRVFISPGGLISRVLAEAQHTHTHGQPS